MKVYDWLTYRGSGKAHAFPVRDTGETAGWSRCGHFFLPEQTLQTQWERAYFRPAVDTDPRCGACQRGINREARQR